MTRVHQADFSTEQSRAQASPRLPCAHGDRERPQGSGAPPGQGSQAPERLIAAAGLAGDVVPLKNKPDSGQLPIEQLRARREFLFAAGGVSERRFALVAQARTRIPQREAAGLGFTATKKVGGAVVRNRARRRLREAARLMLPRLGAAGVDYVLIARKDTADCPWPRLLDDMESALISLRRRLAAGDPSRRMRAPDQAADKG